MSASPRLSLPFLAPGQAQKELLHNEALEILDIVTATAVEDIPLSAPPAKPEPGACYLVGEGASGAWENRQQCLAGYTPGGWRFVAPTAGMTAYVKSLGCSAHYDGTGWRMGEVRGAALFIAGEQVVGPRTAAVPSPEGGSLIDAEARSAIQAILGALRHHGLIAT